MEKINVRIINSFDYLKEGDTKVLPFRTANDLIKLGYAEKVQESKPQPKAKSKGK